MFWIDKINPEYNATKGGDGGAYGTTRSEETKRKIAAAVGNKVRCIETGVVYESVAAAIRDTGATGIYHCLRGRDKTAGGLRWEYC